MIALLWMQDCSAGAFQLQAARCLYNVTICLGGGLVNVNIGLALILGSSWLCAQGLHPSVCARARSDAFHRKCSRVPAPSVNAPCYIERNLLGLCSVSSAERDGVFVLTGWQLLGGAEFVVVSRRMLSAAPPADGDRPPHPTSWYCTIIHY